MELMSIGQQGFDFDKIGAWRYQTGPQFQDGQALSLYLSGVSEPVFFQGQEASMVLETLKESAENISYIPPDITYIPPVPNLNEYFYKADRPSSLQKEHRLQEIEILIGSVWQRCWLNNPCLETPIYEQFCGWRLELAKDFGVELPSP